MKLELTGPLTSASQRRSQRHPPTISHAFLSLAPHQRYEGQVLDESIGGIGLMFDQLLPLQAGQDLEIVYMGVQVWAIVRFVEMTDDARYRVGLQWKTAALADRARELSQLADQECREDCQKFVRLLPSGVYMLWRLLESEKWTDLMRHVQQIHLAATECGLRGLRPYIDQLEAAMPPSEQSDRLPDYLQEFITSCFAATFNSIEA